MKENEIAALSSIRPSGCTPVSGQASSKLCTKSRSHMSCANVVIPWKGNRQRVPARKCAQVNLRGSCSERAVVFVLSAADKEGNCRSPSAGVFEPNLIIAPASLNSYRQRPFRFCGRDRDVGSGDDDALGLRSFNQPRSGSLLLAYRLLRECLASRKDRTGNTRNTPDRPTRMDAGVKLPIARRMFATPMPGLRKDVAAPRQPRTLSPRCHPLPPAKARDISSAFGPHRCAVL